jgi:hypothetical protein
MMIARTMAVAYGEVGAYPVTFVARSGIPKGVPNTLCEIAGERLFRTLLKLVTKYVLGKLEQDTLGVRGALAPARDTEVTQELNRRNAGQEQELYDQVQVAVPESVAALESDLTVQPAVRRIVVALAASEQLATAVEDVLEAFYSTNDPAWPGRLP